MNNCTPALSETAWQFISIVIFVIGFVLTSCYFYTYRSKNNEAIGQGANV